MHNLTKVENYFKECAAELNHPIPGDIKFDSGWQRYPCPYSEESTTSASYNANSDGVIRITIYCHKCKTGNGFTFKSNTSLKLSKAEQEKIQHKKTTREHAESKNKMLALEKMKAEWTSAIYCKSHEYFKNKRLDIYEEYGLKADPKNTLLCPIYSVTKELISLQKIYWDSTLKKFEKRFSNGLSPAGGFFAIGSYKENEIIYVAEGVATAITIHQATKKLVVCVYGKKFDIVAPTTAKLYPKGNFIFCADQPSLNECNTSEDNAKKAISLIGGSVFLPDFSKIPPDIKPEIPRSDFNDLLVLQLEQGICFDYALEEIRIQLNPKAIGHSKIFNELTKKVTPLDFRAISGISEKENLRKAHFLIITIENLLKLAKTYAWNICCHQESLYLFNGEYWNMISYEEFSKFLGNVAEATGVDPFQAKYYEFKEHLLKQFISSANLPKPEQPKNTIYINLKNGTLVITPEETNLQLFNRNNFLTYQLPFNYDPNATASIFEQYLNQVLPNIEKQKILAEYLGYIFISTEVLKLEKVLLLYGSGANGKSVFYEIVRSLLGEQNISGYSLQSLTDDKGYYRAEIVNMLVNYTSEINTKLNTSIFKQLISGEPVDARSPYGKPFTIKNYAKFIFNCNELPKDVEQTRAFFRRFLIIPFDVTIPEAEQDKQLAQKIIATELSGVLNWVLEGLNRLLKQKQFTYCKSVEEVCSQYEEESDSVKLFIKERKYQTNSKEHKRVSSIYSEYRDFCREGGYMPVNQTNFSKRLKALGVNIERKSHGMVAYVVEV